MTVLYRCDGCQKDILARQYRFVLHSEQDGYLDSFAPVLYPRHFHGYDCLVKFLQETVPAALQRGAKEGMT